MIKRLIFGLVFGIVSGAVVAAVAIKGLGLLTFGEGWGPSVIAYALAAGTGVLVGLIAGKPIWGSNAKIEAGLKAFFGALIASGLFFVLRKWIPLHVPFDLAQLGLAPSAATEIGQLPAVALPLIGALLGGFYEADNTPDAASDAAEGGAKAKAGAKVRVAGKAAAEAVDDEDESAAKKAKH